MKKTYTTPEISVVLFENEDIVTTSGLVDQGGDLGDNVTDYDDFLN